MYMKTFGVYLSKNEKITLKTLACSKNITLKECCKNIVNDILSDYTGEKLKLDLFQVSLPVELSEKLKEESKKTGFSMGELFKMHLKKIADMHNFKY